MAITLIERNYSSYIPGAFNFRPIGQCTFGLIPPSPQEWNSNYLCQSFKATRNYKLLTTKFYVEKGVYTYSAEECVVDLYRADGNGRPTGGVLNYGSFVSTDSFSWQEVNWELNYELIKDTQYCFTLRQLDIIGSCWTGSERIKIATNAFQYTDGVLSMSNIFPTHSSPTNSPLPDNGWHIPWQAGGGANEDMLFRNYGEVEEAGLVGSIDGISSLSGHIKKHTLIEDFPPDRQTDPTEPNYYNPDLFWLPGEWVGDVYTPPAWGSLGDSTYVATGGGRWNDPLVAIGNNKVYFEDYYQES